MYYKIQPEQIQLHSFSSPSGDLVFETGSNYVYANIARYLIGDFEINGGLSINGQAIKSIDGTNSTTGTNCFILGGTYNSATGSKNVILNGSSNTIYGTGNTVVNGYNSSSDADSSNNTLLAGSAASFGSGVKGAVILKDFGAYAAADNGNETLTISFVSGVYFQKGKIILKDTDFHLSNLSSGFFSGDCDFLGGFTKNGVGVATTGDLSTTSGILNIKIADTGSSLYTLITGDYSTLSGSINSTGSSLAASISGTGSTLVASIDATGATLSSQISALGSNFVYATGTQTISGQKSFELRPIMGGTGFMLSGDLGAGFVYTTGIQSIDDSKTFTQDVTFAQSIFIQGTGGIQSGVSGRTQIVPTGSGHATGSRGLLAYSGEFLYYKISDDPHLWVRHSGQLTWP